MIEPEFTSAERKALEATKLESFPVNLPEVRRTIATLLTEFGRYGFFNEYTTPALTTYTICWLHWTG